MKIKESTLCKLCGSDNCHPVLMDRPDYEYGVTHIVNYWKCSNGKCGLVFVSPVPTLKRISEFYNQYSTHNANPTLTAFSYIARVSRIKYLKYLNSLFESKILSNINVLDYGCGNGNLLIDLKKIGIQNLIGYDMDPVACSFAESQGIDAFSNIEGIRINAPYDYIFFNHVVEHLVDASIDIKTLSQFLKENGRIVVRTPNSNSFLAKIFRSNWRGWETPRHLNIFNNRNISAIFKNMEIEKSSTSNLMFSGIFNESFHSSFFRNNIIGKIIRKLLFVIILPVALLFNYISSTSGEELCVIAKQKN